MWAAGCRSLSARARCWGCVTGLAEESAHATLKPILKVIGTQTLITPKILQLARWIGEYYCCAPEIALKSVLPEAVRHEEAGLRERLYVRVLPLTGEPPKLAKRQEEVWRILQERKELPLQELLTLAQTTAATVRRLEDKGLVAIAPEISERDPYAREHILPTQPLPLNAAQAKALQTIVSPAGAVVHPPQAPLRRTGHLTLVTAPCFCCTALPAAARRKSICKPSPTHWSKARARLCSCRKSRSHRRRSSASRRGSARDRCTRWWRCCTAICPPASAMMSGTRFARAAPGSSLARARPSLRRSDSLGLIVVDEEHEHTYKQEEAPRYHARDVAIVRGQMENATVVLGSATPSLESYYNCQQGQIHAAGIARAGRRQEDARGARRGHAPDRARRQGGPHLLAAARRSDRPAAGTQGAGHPVPEPAGLLDFAAVPAMRVCRRVPELQPVADLPSAGAEALLPHLRHTAPVPAACPNDKCRNPAIRYAGLGTQKVEETLAKLFPHARLKRMDSDALKRKEDYRRILGDFRVGKIDILVGTQMIAKGLHFPNVTLVGIIYADLALHQPDFRAGERTFQLLTQVAGRAGRGDIEGEVFVQAFTPFHPAIQFARRHDFAGFYEQEMEFREQLKYPPVSRVALLTLKGPERGEGEVRCRLPET